MSSEGKALDGSGEVARVFQFLMACSGGQLGPTAELGWRQIISAVHDN